MARFLLTDCKTIYDYEQRRKGNKDDEVIGDSNVEFLCHVLGEGHDGLLAAVPVVAGNHAVEEGVCAFCKSDFALLEYVELCVAVSELCAAGCEVISALVKLSFTFCELLLCVCEHLFGFLKLLQTVFILLELCLAFSDHLLHVCGEVGNIFGDLKSEVLCEGTNNAHEPKLCGIEAGELCQRAVTELDVLIEVRHKRLDLLKHCLAFVVSLGVVGDLLLAFFVSLLAFFVSLLAFGVCLLTGCELCCAFVVGCKSVGEGVCAVKVSLLIFLFCPAAI